MKNKIIRLNAPHCLEILEKDISINLDEDEVLVEIDRISLCGSDLKLYNGCYNAPSLYPIVIGHEWAGKTIITGNKVTKVKVGDKVTGDCSIYCGKCPECNIDKNICRNIEKYGITRNGFGQKYKIVPERYLYKSSHILENKYLALTECFSVALHAIKKMKLIANAQNDEILIIGGGSIGVAIYLLLTYVYKLNNVFILESSTAKVSFLKKVYPDLKVINEILGCSKYSKIFEASGSLYTFEKALDWVMPYGSIVCIGFLEKGVLNISSLITKCINIQGSIGGTGEFEDILNIFKENSMPLDQFITEEIKSEHLTGYLSSNRNVSLKIQVIL